MALGMYNFDQRVVMKIRKPETTANIWSSGKIVCMGAKTEEEAKKSARRFGRILQQLVNENVKFKEYSVVKVLGVLKLPFTIKLETFSKAYKEASYESKLSPCVKYKCKISLATLKIFSTGKITINAPNIYKAQQAAEIIYPLVKAYQICKAVDLKLQNPKTIDRKMASDHEEKKPEDRTEATNQGNSVPDTETWFPLYSTIQHGNDKPNGSSVQRAVETIYSLVEPFQKPKNMGGKTASVHEKKVVQLQPLQKSVETKATMPKFLQIKMESKLLKHLNFVTSLDDPKKVVCIVCKSKLWKQNRTEHLKTNKHLNAVYRNGNLLVKIE